MSKPQKTHFAAKFYLVRTICFHHQQIRRIICTAFLFLEKIILRRTRGRDIPRRSIRIQKLFPAISIISERPLNSTTKFFADPVVPSVPAKFSGNVGIWPMFNNVGFSVFFGGISCDQKVVVPISSVSDISLKIRRSSGPLSIVNIVRKVRAFSRHKSWRASSGVFSRTFCFIAEQYTCRDQVCDRQFSFVVLLKRISHCYFFFRTKRILFSRLSKFKRELRGQNMETTGLFIWVGGRLTYTIINTAPGLSEYIKKFPVAK